MNVAVIVGLVAGSVLLVAGAEALVRGASRIAAAAGISPLVIGLTVVAFGTSAPELAVSVGAALRGSAEVAVGNVLGSNVLNVLLILGASALAGGLAVQQRVVRIDVPLLLLITAGAWALAADGRIGRVEGGLGVVGAAVYTVWSYRASRKEPDEVKQEYVEAFGVEAGAARRGWVFAVVAVILGLAGLVIGARLLVGAATGLAEALGVSQLVIGLTVVAGGTSLPELATSVIAAFRGERDIAVGNVVGSNLFNLLIVLGATSVVSSGGLQVPEQVFRFDFVVAFLVVLVALPALATGLRMERWEGALLLLTYIGYVIAVVLTGTASPSAVAAQRMLFAALAMVTVVLWVVGISNRRRRVVLAEGSVRASPEDQR